MINIRQGAFETNSSSMHSLIIVKNVKEEKGWETEEDIEYANGHSTSGSCGWFITKNPGGIKKDNPYAGYVRVYENSFERGPFMLLNGWIDKAIYLIAQWNSTNSAKDKINDLVNIIREEIPNFKGFKFNNGYNWNSKKGKWDDEKSDDYGNVDHQSIGLTPDRLGVSIHDYLFDPSIIVIIDGDETQTFNQLIKIGLVDKNKILKQTD